MNSLPNLVVGVAIALLAVSPVAAQQAAPPKYGPEINLAQATKAMDAAEAEARKNGWAMAIAVVGPTGELVLFRKLDDTQHASPLVAQHKAMSAAIYRRPSKAFEDRVAAGGVGVTVMSLAGAIASEGDVPIIIDGKIIGAIGASGGTPQQDGVVASAGAAAVK